MLVASVIPPTPLPYVKALAAAMMKAADIRIVFFVIANFFNGGARVGLVPRTPPEMNNCFSYSDFFSGDQRS
jgi:hypothetical protein